jgi:hypothetical protein
MSVKFCRPIQRGASNRLYSVNDRYSENTIGPAIRNRKPAIQGDMNR